MSSRWRRIGAPVAVIDGRRLSNTVRPVLYPVFAMRRRVWIPGGGTAKVVGMILTNLSLLFNRTIANVQELNRYRKELAKSLQTEPQTA